MAVTRYSSRKKYGGKVTSKCSLYIVYCDVYHNTVLIIFKRVLISYLNNTETSLLTKEMQTNWMLIPEGITWILYSLIMCEWKGFVCVIMGGCITGAYCYSKSGTVEDYCKRLIENKTTLMTLDQVTWKRFSNWSALKSLESVLKCK